MHFSEYDGRVAWCPLAPREVRYPAALTIGFRSGKLVNVLLHRARRQSNYPTYNNYCEAQPFRTQYINHVTYVNNVTNVYNNGSPSFNRYYNSAEFYASNRNTYLQNNHFVPYNARTAAGVTSVTTAGFGRRTAYDLVARANGAGVFSNGRMVAAPGRGNMPVAGPVGVRPTRESLTPTHTFLASAQPSARAMARPVFQAPLPSSVARRAAPLTPSGQIIRQAPNGQITRTGRDNTNPPQTGSRESGRVGSFGNNSAGNSGRELPPSLSTGRGSNGGATNSGNNRTATGNPNGTASENSGNIPSRTYRGDVNTGRAGLGSPATNGTTNSANENGSARPGRAWNSGRTDAGTNSAADAARRARGNVGLPSARNSQGTPSGSGTVERNSSFGNTRGDGSGTQDGSYRRTGGNDRSYRPGVGDSGSTGTTGTGSSSGATGRTGTSGAGDTRWSADRGRGRGEDARASSPTSRPGGDTSPRSYTPRTYGDNPPRANGDSAPRGYVPRTSGESSSRTYSPPQRNDSDTRARGYSSRDGSGNSSSSNVPSTRGGNEGIPRTYSPPPRPTTPEPPRQSSGSGNSSSTRSPMPPPRQRDPEPSNRPASSGRERSGGSDSGSSDKDKGGSDRSRGARGH